MPIGILPRSSCGGLAAGSGPGCDELIGRLERLREADARCCWTLTRDRRLVTRRSRLDDAADKHCEDLGDALLCAWRATFWHRARAGRLQVLAPAAPARERSAATIIAANGRSRVGHRSGPGLRRLVGPPLV